jgi:hypothetical protein
MKTRGCEEIWRPIQGLLYTPEVNQGACLVQLVICGVGLDIDSFECVGCVDYELRRVYLGTQIVFEKLMCRCKAVDFLT